MFGGKKVFPFPCRVEKNRLKTGNPGFRFIDFEKIGFRFPKTGFFIRENLQNIGIIIKKSVFDFWKLIGFFRPKNTIFCNRKPVSLNPTS